MERRGIPSVLVAHESFASAARNQAKLMGLPGLNIVEIPEPEAGTFERALGRDAESAFEKIVTHLLVKAAKARA
ncbi:MAG: hypothetical protein ABIH46_06975 [Chloroflexota bacterium]